MSQSYEIPPYNVFNWAYELRRIMIDLGLPYLLQSGDFPDTDTGWLTQFAKTKLTELYISSWQSEVTNSRKLRTYITFKSCFRQELYLNELKNYKHRRALSRLRLSSHHLNIETGRFYSIPEDQRICPMCNTGNIENEFHFVLVCPRYEQLRVEHIPSLYLTRRSQANFKDLMSTTDKYTLCCLSKYIYCSFEIRQQASLSDA